MVTTKPVVLHDILSTNHGAVTVYDANDFVMGTIPSSETLADDTDERLLFEFMSHVFVVIDPDSRANGDVRYGTISAPSCIDPDDPDDDMGTVLVDVDFATNATCAECGRHVLADESHADGCTIDWRNW